MNNLQNNDSRLPAGRQDTERRNTPSGAPRRLPFFIEFVKFATGFAVIVAVALFMLNVASAAMQ